MFLKSSFEIIGDTGIETSVFTSKNIHVPHYPSTHSSLALIVRSGWFSSLVLSGLVLSDQTKRVVQWLPRVVASHSRQPQVIQLVVKMYVRRSKRILLSLIDPLPPEPAPRQPVYLNTVVEALKIRSFISDSPTPMTWDKTAKTLNISTSKIAHLLKIVNTLPPDFVDDMRQWDDPRKLKLFNGRRLLYISRLKTEKERRIRIKLLLRNYKRFSPRPAPLPPLPPITPDCQSNPQK